MYQHWGCTSIYRPLSYPFRSLLQNAQALTLSSFRDYIRHKDSIKNRTITLNYINNEGNTYLRNKGYYSFLCLQFFGISLSDKKEYFISIKENESFFQTFFGMNNRGQVKLFCVK